MSPRANSVNTRPISILLGLAFLGTFGSQAFVQVFASDRVIKQAEEVNRGAQRIPLVGTRGSILDRYGEPLATNGKLTSISVVRGKVPESDAFWLAVSTSTGIPAAELAARTLGLKSEKTASWLVPMTPSQLSEFRQVVKVWRADGLSAQGSEERHNPLGPAASNLVGVIAKQEKGLVKTELEYHADAILKPENGYITAFLDRRGYVLPNRIVDPGRPAKNGQDIRLTIDSEMQRVAYESLREVVMREKVDGGAAVAMNPKTGAIYAATSFPSIDPLTGVYDGFTPEFANKPQTLLVEAGSTFKILSLAIALQEGKTTLHEPFLCKGAMKIGGYTLHCDLSHGPHGQLDSVGAIEVSCNMDAARWSMSVGSDKFQSYFKRLGVLAKPGIFSAASEKFGDFNDNDYSKQLQIATVGFGQNIKTTPLSLLNAFAAIANDGVRPTAHLIQRIGENEAPMPVPIDRPIDVSQGNATAVNGRIFSVEVAQQVKEAMRSVFDNERGTGKRLKIPGYPMGGKTGTAETGKNRENRSSNFIGFLPAKDPEVVILVMIQNKRRKFYGGKYAGSVFQDIALSAIDRLKIKSNDPAAFRTWREQRDKAPKP